MLETSLTPRWNRFGKVYLTYNIISHISDDIAIFNGRYFVESFSKKNSNLSNLFQEKNIVFTEFPQKIIFFITSHKKQIHLI